VIALAKLALSPFFSPENSSAVASAKWKISSYILIFSNETVNIYPPPLEFTFKVH